MTGYFEWTLTPDTGCEIDFTSFVYTGQASGTGPTSFSFRSSVDGFTSNIGAPSAGGTTLNLSAPAYQNISGPITFRFYGWGASGSGGTFSINNFTFNGTTSCGPPPSNTITTGTVSPLTYNVDCTTGEAGTVGFTSTEVYNGGNVFTAELSDATGSFAAPTSIGTLAASGADPSGTINITIPAGTLSGTGYRIRVISSNPGAIGTDNGANITINLSGGPCVTVPPHMSALMINACDDVCSEGQNELVFFNTGDYSVEMNSSNFILTYGSFPSPTANYTDPMVTNPGTTDDLNTEAGCPGLFIDGTGLTIPPNSPIMLALDEVCPDEITNLSGLCGSGPIYVIYTTTASSWKAIGNFVNTASGLRYLTTEITSTDGNTHIINYSFDSDLNINDDGDYALWNSSGGLAYEHGNNNCEFEPNLLPVELIGFYGLYKSNSNQISWTTATELNNNYFNLYYSSDGKQFSFIHKEEGHGTKGNQSEYEYIHYRYNPGINYYKLESVDYDGTVHDKGIISVLAESNNVYYNESVSRIIFSNKSDYALYSPEGRLIETINNRDSYPFTGKGIYFVINTKTGEKHKLFIGY